MRGATPLAWSLELGTTGLLKAGSTTAPLLGRLPAGTRIFLPALPTDPPSAMEDALRLLQRENPGLVPIPHIAASREPSIASLESKLAAWQRATADGVRETLIVRGDPHATHSTADSLAAGVNDARQGGSEMAFRTSLELLETGALQRCGVETVSLCGHPEGVGGLSADAARAALSEKLQWAASSDVRARVVTQFCFDSDATQGFVDALRSDGLDVDVSLGVVGPSSLALRRRMAERCGVSPPLEDHATPYVRRIAAWQEARASRGVQSLHIYPFGGLAKALRWMHDELPCAPHLDAGNGRGLQLALCPSVSLDGV